jgi:phytoene synthase
MQVLEASYTYAARISRAQAKNFYYTFRFLPPPRRRSIFAVYAYSRRLDDAVDSAVAANRTRGGLEAARERLAYLQSFLSAAPPEDPLVPALADTIYRYEIPVHWFEELIRGMHMDLEISRYRTFEELRLYCFRAASAVGLICLEIFGHQGESARRPAEDLGIAMQLTNIIRDVTEDLSRGRIYLPLEDLERFGCSEADLGRTRATAPLRALIRFEVDRAREYFRRAEALFPLVLPQSRYCPVLLKRLYSRLLDRIEGRGYDVFRRRPRLSLFEKLGLAASTWLEARRSR